MMVMLKGIINRMLVMKIRMVKKVLIIMKMLWGKRLRISGKEKKGDKNEDTEEEISHSSA